MRSLNAVQEERSKVASLATVPLVKLTTYSDRDAETVGTVFYLSDRSLSYKYDGGAAKEFKPWLLRLNNLNASMTHLPSPAAGELLAQSFSLTLRNMMWPETEVSDDTKRVIKHLRENYPLEMATVEVSQIIIPHYTGPYPQDLTSYTGDEHTVFHRGKVSRLGPITEGEIQIQCTKDSPEIDWNRPTDPAKASPRDIGNRYPRPYGSFTKLPLTGHTVGWATTLAQALTDTETGVKYVTNATGFPASGTFYLNVEGEELTCTASTDTTITISARGSNNAAHAAGVSIVELITEMIQLVADHGFAPISDLTTLYVRNPFNAELVRVDTAYTFTAYDEAAESGLVLSTVRMTLAQLREMYERLFVAARITVQPSFDSGTSHSNQTVDLGKGGSLTSDVSCKRGIWREETYVWWDYHADYVRSGWEEDFPGSLDGAKDVLRWRLTITVEARTSGNGSHPCKMTLEDGVPGITAGTNISVDVPNTASSTATATSVWFTPPASTHLSDLTGNTMGLTTVKGYPGSQEFNVTEWGIEADLDEGGGTQEMDIETESVGLGLGYDHEFYADGEGAVVPEIALQWTEVYDLDDDDLWSVSTSMTRYMNVINHYPGAGETASQQLVLAFTKRVRCESADSSQAANWNAGANTNKADETGTGKYTEGSAGVKGWSTSASNTADMDFTMAGTVNLTAGDDLLVLMDLRVDYQGASTDGDIQVKLGNGSSHYNYWDIPCTQFLDDEWATVSLLYDSGEDGTVGEPAFTTWDFVGFVWNNGSVQVSGMNLRIDNIRTIPRYGRAQRNSISPPLDMQSSVSEWRFAMYIESAAKSLINDVTIYFDNTAGGGTTMPSPNSYTRWHYFTHGFPEAKTWAVDPDLTCDASGDEDAVQTIQIELDVRYTGSTTFPLIDDDLTVYVDRIQAKTAVSDNYDADEGEMIEKPSDCVVHWVEAIGGKTTDGTTITSALTNLGSDKLAVDMRTLTPGSWKIGLAALGYLSRANIIPAETSTGTVYKMLTAETDYEWPTDDRELTTWGIFSEAGPMEREVWTRFTCLYDFNAATGPGNERNYEGFLRANEDDTDLSDPSAGEMTTAVTKYGNMAAPTVFLGGINDSDTAKDIFGYYVHEGIRAPRVFLFSGCPWWEVYDLEAGDIVSFTHPWSGAIVKARIIGYTKVFRSEANELRCLEVN